MDSKNKSSTVERRLVLLAVGALGFSAVVTQLVLMRELLCAFGGSEIVLGIILGNWLLLTGLGAWMGRCASRMKEPLRWLIVAQLLIAVLPPLLVFLLRAYRDVIFIRGASVGVMETVAATFVLLLPYCLVSGFFLTLGCAILVREDRSAGIGRVYVTDSLGSIAGGAVFSFVLVWWLDHIGLLLVPACANLLLAVVFAVRGRRKILAALAVVLLGVTVAVALWVDVDGLSTAMQYPGQKIVFRGNSPYGKLLVASSAGQFDFIENGLPVISTNQIEQVEETVHYAMSQRPQAKRVLLVSGGVSGTAREILKYGVSEVTYVELDPLIIEVGREYLPENFEDARINVVNTDGRLFVQRTAEKFDVVIVDMPDPSTSQINRFYTSEFFEEVKRSLAPDGVMSIAIGRYENYVSTKLARMLSSVHRTLRGTFDNALMIPGGRVFFLASNSELHADIAARLESSGVRTQLLNRSYLDAVMRADRIADMKRAVEQASAMNTDFNPVLYFYHLVHWVSQFKVRFGLFEAALLALLLIYVVWLRPVTLAIFASGFAATTLEIVLLLGFQILCGSVYYQMGIIVTVFMAGLAAGAFLMNRARLPMLRKHLSWLAFGIAAFALLLPVLLTELGRVAIGSGLTVVQAGVAAMTFVLAALVGMEFPLASRLETGGGAVTASRLYTADFLGAFVGALLASTLLIPLFGVWSTCMLAAGLNALSGALVLTRRG